MNLPRRKFLHLAAGAVVLPAAWRIARAQSYPARPVRWIVPFPAGGATDLVARIMGQWLSERLGQPFVIENRAGAGGNIGTQAVVSSPADGYTLLLIPTASAINATLYPQLPYNFLRDIAPVAALVRMANIVVVHPSVPATTVAEFISYSKANPGKVNMASPGTGTAVHMAGELFKALTGIELVHVPYRGGAPATADLVAGQVQVQFDLMPQSIAHVKAGRLRALAVTTANRAEELPELPTVAETVPGYEASTWFGVGAPKGTASEIVATLNREINAGLADPLIKARLAEVGTMPLLMTSAEFGAHLAAETEKWGKVVKFAGVKPE